MTRIRMDQKKISVSKTTYDKVENIKNFLNREFE